VPNALWYPDRHWANVFPGNAFFTGDTFNYIDPRFGFFTVAYSTSPGMAVDMENVGVKYPVTFVDASGESREGANSYKLNLPKGIPAVLFWSVTVYDPVTGSGLDNGQPFPSINTMGQAGRDLHRRRLRRRRLDRRGNLARAQRNSRRRTARPLLEKTGPERHRATAFTLGTLMRFALLKAARITVPLATLGFVPLAQAEMPMTPPPKCAQAMSSGPVTAPGWPPSMSDKLAAWPISGHSR